MTDRLDAARLLLVFTPQWVEAERGPGTALEVLEACWPEVDVVQVRVKTEGATSGPSPARELYEWTRRVLDLARERGSASPLVTVNDRVDVAIALADEGCAGCHVGRRDLPPAEARSLLGPELVLGLSTRTMREVSEADAKVVDYVGFGPIHPTRTKGYGEGLGPEAAWVAASGCAVPLFPIGGVDEAGAADLAPVGRAAVGAAILGADDPAAAARRIARSLGGG